VISSTIQNDGVLNEHYLYLVFSLSKPSNNFAKNNITINQGTITNFIKKNSLLYTAKYVPDRNGDCYVQILEGVFSDSVNNVNIISNQFSFEAVNVKPTVNITSIIPTGTTTNATSIPIYFNLSSNGINFSAQDVVVTNGVLYEFKQISPKKYSAVLAPLPIPSGKVIKVNVPKDSFNDLYNNTNYAAKEFSWTSDTERPILTISAKEIVSGATSDNPFITLTFTSSKPTTSFSLNSITVKHGTLSKFTRVSSTEYTAIFVPNPYNPLNFSIYNSHEYQSIVTSIQVYANKFYDLINNANKPSNIFTWRYQIENPDKPQYVLSNSRANPSILSERVYYKPGTVASTASTNIGNYRVISRRT